MNLYKLFIPFIGLTALVLSASCECGSEKRNIEKTMREYAERQLGSDKDFEFIGLSNRRDTIFMGSKHPCRWVIYTIADRESGKKTRHCADVVFSNDFKSALSIKEMDCDPIAMVEDAIKKEVKTRIIEKLNK